MGIYAGKGHLWRQAVCAAEVRRVSPSGSEFASEETRYAGNGPDYSYGSYAQTPSRAPKYRYLLMAQLCSPRKSI